MNSPVLAGCDRRQLALARLAGQGDSRRLHVFCAGIGGTGLSGLARLALALGHRVSGSERAPSPTSRALEAAGVSIFYEQRAGNIDGSIDLLVATAALPADHPELTAAREAGIPCAKYAEALGALVASRDGIAVAGTHGKTTTTALTAQVLWSCGVDPSFIVGGDPKDLGVNAALGRGRALVFEACEYDRSFRHYQPAIAVILNVEADHLDCYPDLAAIEAAFAEFAAQTRAGGLVVANADCPHALGAARTALRSRPDLRLVTFSLDGNPADYSASDLRLERGLPSCELRVAGAETTRLQLSIPGRHNAGNALAALAVAGALGVPLREAARAAESFQGVRRRFDLLRPRGDILVVDDYAHHPTAVRAVVAAARSRYPDRRVVALFEPHQASRTRQLFQDFAESLATADRVVIGDIYACRDRPEDVASVSAADLAAAVAALAPASEPVAPGGPDALREAALALLQPGDVALFLGAGRISAVAHQVAEALPPSPSSGLRRRVASAAYPRVRPLEESLARDLGQTLRLQEPIAPHCTFKAGGRARFLVEPGSLTEAIHAVRTLQGHGVPWVPVGGGSNLLFAADPYDGCVVLTRGLKGVQTLGSTLRAAAGAGLQGALRAAERAGLDGLAGFAGIPGTVGGAVFGNAGGPPGTPAVAERVARVLLLEPDGQVRWHGPERLGVRYRHTDLQGCLVLAVDLQLDPGADPAVLRQRRLELIARKAAVQPVDARSAGCVFRNPTGESAGRLIDRLGLKGLRHGGASVSTLHGNFIVNDGAALPADILGLIAEVRERVLRETGHTLQPELRIVT